jgi:phosphoribosylamine--glycine ligase
MADGEHVLPFATSAGPQAPAATATSGPNTGGMGAYSPAPVVTPAMHDADDARGDRTRPSRGMAAEGTPYTGFLYAGLMIAAGRHARACSSSTAASATRKRSRS